MRTALYFGLVLLLLLSLQPHSLAVRLPGVTYTYSVAPDGGDKANILTNGVTSDSVGWSNGDGKPLNVGATFKLPGAPALDRIKVFSTGINVWWWVPHIKVTGRASGAKDWQTLLDRDWYERKPSVPGEPQDVRTFDVTIQTEGKRYEEVRVEISRPSIWVLLPLSEVEFHISDAIETAIGTNWTAYTVGQTCNGTLRLDSSMKTSVKGAKVTVEVINADTRKKVGACLEEKVDLPGGIKEISFTYPTKTVGRFYLRARLDGPVKGKVIAYNSPIIEVLPPRSKYWFPIGTCIGAEDTPHYGFSAWHYWDQMPKTETFWNGQDHYTAFTTDGTLSSHFAGADWKDSKELGFSSDDAQMVNAEGKKFGQTLHLPKYELTKTQAERLDYWDGHPGMFEFCYNNELCYVTWAVGGIVDYNKFAIADYHKWLAELYGTIDKLNGLYMTSYKSFDEVQAPREYKGPAPDWYDWLQFRKFGLAKYTKLCYDTIKPHLRNTIITPKAISNVDYFASSTAIDPWLWKDSGDVYGYDLYPWARDGYLEAPFGMDFQRTQTPGKNIEFLESNLGYWRPGQRDRKAIDFNRSYWPSFLRSLRGCYWYEWYAPWDLAQRDYYMRYPDGTLFETGQEAVRMAKQVQSLAPVLNFANPIGVQVALYYPWEEVDQTPNIAPLNAARGAYKVLTQLHYPLDIITFHNVEAGELSKYKVLVLADAQHMMPEVAAAIDKFVADGGLVISDMQAGLWDEYNRETRSLENVFGVKHIQPNDGLTQLALTNSKKIDLPVILTKPSPFGDSGAYVGPQSRAEVVAVAEECKVLATFPDTMLKGAVSDDVKAQTPTYKMPEEVKGDTVPPSGLPAVVTHKYGKGETLYAAASMFAAYRNYFYTLDQPPHPVTRDNELLNVGDPITRKLVGDFLAAHQILPPADVDVHDEDSEADDTRFQILSFTGNEHCAIMGVTNWGPRFKYQVPAYMDLPFKKAQALYYIDTPNETLKSLPFTMEKNRLKTTIPYVQGTALLVVVGDSGPVIVTAEQSGDAAPVQVRVINHLAEKAAGSIQLRIDGIAEPASEAIPFELTSGQQGSYKLPVKKLDQRLLVDNRGIKRPWYVWVTYDGTARSFARVHPTGSLMAP